MNFDEILDQLAQVPSRQYSYVLLAAVIGPLTLRLFGLKTLSQLVRPLALLVFLGGMYAKQQAGRSTGLDETSR
ncbi:MAG: hypothetical protein M3R24_07350 [Chloroflexota bacterium]|nr:hypothetical protein [Chloroflexota bacterium]PLS83343.1 MAG: hypothetical protein CYG59_01560 [Chloroflexota bacterium]